MMRITLKLNGQEKSFSEQELITILEDYYSLKEKNKNKANTTMAEVPTEGKWFEVNPQAINQELFKESRKDRRQENTRQLIVEAFQKVNKNPEKYAKPFKIMMPKKAWSSKTIAEFKQYAELLGDHMADWVEQALEWAQRIANGESWETVCNEPDTANWYRLVVWKNGYTRLVGSSRVSHYPASDVDDRNYGSNDRLSIAVPLVVLR